MIGGIVTENINGLLTVRGTGCEEGNICHVQVPAGPARPQPGDSVWWQCGKVYWSRPVGGIHDFPLDKIGNSY